MPPAGGRGRRGSAVPQARERLRRPGSAGRFVRPRAQRARTERACRGSAKEPARRAAARPPARPPALCGARLGHRRVGGHSSAEGYRARRQPEQSQSAKQPHAGGREKERVSVSREGSLVATRPRRANARSEGAQSRAGGLSASIKPPGSCPQVERRARNLKTLCSPGFPQPSPSPCESWGLPYPPAPSSRWVFFLVFL